MRTPRSNGGGKGRRYVLIGVTLLAMAAFGVAFVASSGANLTPSTFEGNDGNMVVNTAGHTDWQSLSANPGLQKLSDLPSGSGDNSFGQGTKENDTNVTVVSGTIPPNKNDLNRGYLFNEQVGGSSFLYLAWERAANTGDAHIDFELNQHGTPGFTASTTGSVTLNRTAGDLLISYDFGGSGTPDITLFKWSGTQWANQQDLSSLGFAEAGVNSSTLTDVLNNNASVGVGDFGEASVNLSDALVAAGFNPDTCEAFGSVTLKARSSGSSTSAELKDFIAPVPIHVSNCATPTITTQTSVSSLSVGQTAGVGDSATLSNANNPTGKLTFTLYSDAACQNSTGVTGQGTISNGQASVSGLSFTPNATGTYYWGVSYPGDNHNNAVTVCGGENEEIEVLAPGLNVTKTADHATVNAGDPIGFTITVSNSGAGSALGVTLSDPLPSGTAAGWTVQSQTNSGQCSISAGTLNCSAVDLASGGSFSVHVTAGTTYAACTKYDNTATAHASNAPDAQDSASIQCQKPALSVIKTPDNATVSAGEPIGFTVTVANAGPGTAKAVTLADPLPSGTAAGWTVQSQTNSGQCTISSNTLSCTAVDLAAAESFSVHITAGTSYAACTKYDNTATAHASNAPDAQDSASVQCQKPALSVTKTPDNATVSAGDQIGFTVSVANAGPGTAKGVTLSDPLPTGTAGAWTIQSQTNSGQCSISAGTLSCSAVDLAAAESFSVHVVAGTSYAACTKYDNTATAHASNAPDAQDSASVQCQKPSLTVTKTADNATVNAGDPLGFTVTVSNGGPGTAKGVTLSDPLPSGTAAGWTIASQTNSGQCSISAGTLNCSAVDLASGHSFSVHVTAGTTYAACTKYDNTATAHASNAPDAQDSASVQCQKPSLTVNKTADKATVDAGDTIGFTITVSNGGPGTAKGVTLSDPLPSGTAAGWTVQSQTNSGQCSISAGTLNCSAVDLASGHSFSVHVTAGTTYAACTKYDNTATAHASNAPDAQDSASVQCQKPSLTVTKTADKTTVNAGDPIGFTVTVSNGGPGTAKAVTLSDPLPAGTATDWTISPAYAGQGTCSVNGASGSQSLDCSFGNLASGHSASVHVRSTTAVAACTKYDNTATASASNAPDAQDSAGITCLKPGLSVIKTADHKTVNAGEQIGFTVTVGNGGPGTANGVTLHDPLPAGTTNAGWTIESGPSNCSISGAVGSQSLDCTAVDLAAGDSYDVHVTADTSFADCTTYDNTATASAANAPDAQDSASVECRKPALSVTKTADNATVNAGDPLGFTVTVANAGPGTAKAVTLTDPLPAGTATDWTIDPAYAGPGSCAVSGPPGSQSLQCSFGDMASGDSASVHVTSTTSFAACTAYDNTATASASNSPDAQGSASIVCSPAQVSITKTADHSAPVNAGDQIGFTVEVKNSGNGDASGVTLNDSLPVGSGSGVTWTIDSSVGTPGQFVLSGAKGSQTLSLDSSTLPAGADYKVHIVASTSQTECSVYDNTATLTTGNAGNPEPVSASESCAYRVDLSISKTGSPATQHLGEGNITWTMAVTNRGPDTDTNVQITDPMPTGNTFVSASTDKPGATCTGGAILHCSLGTMAANDTVTITLVTTPSAAGPQTNTVMVVGDRHETDTTNNTATATVQVTGPFVPVYCVAVSKIIPKQLYVGRKTGLTIHLTKGKNAAKGFKVRIKGPKVDITTKRSNGKGIIKQTLKAKKAGILVFTPLVPKPNTHCNTKRVGITGVFTPPVTG